MRVGQDPVRVVFLVQGRTAPIPLLLGRKAEKIGENTNPRFLPLGTGRLDCFLDFVDGIGMGDVVVRESQKGIGPDLLEVVHGS